MADPINHTTRRYVRAVGPFNGFRAGGNRIPVLIFNLNIGGGFVSSNEALTATTFALSVELPEEGEITVLAQTVYRDRSGVGVRFIDLEEQDVKRLGRAVERMRAQQTTSPPVVKLPEASVVYMFERNSEVMQIEARYNSAAQTFHILRRLADGTTIQESFSGEPAFRSRLDEIRSALEQDAWHTAGPNLLTDSRTV